LTHEGRGEVGRRHQHDQILEPLIAQKANVFDVVALFDEAKSFLNFPSGEINSHDPP
jgi:hypothetical protein